MVMMSIRWWWFAMFHLSGRSGLNSDTYQLNCDDTFCNSSSIVLKIFSSWWLLALQEHLPYADDSTAVTPKSELNGGIIVDTPTKMGLSRWDHRHHHHQHHHRHRHHFQQRRQIHQDGAKQVRFFFSKWQKSQITLSESNIRGGEICSSAWMHNLQQNDKFSDPKKQYLFTFEKLKYFRKYSFEKIKMLSFRKYYSIMKKLFYFSSEKLSNVK